MRQEYFCPQHGPYTSVNGQCPYCNPSARPGAPEPLGSDPDDIPTDPGPGGWGSPKVGNEYPDEDNMATHIPGKKGGYAGDEEDEIDTHIPVHGQRGKQRIDDTELFDESEQVGLLGILWVKSGHRRGKTIMICDGTVIGRKDAEPVSEVLDDPKVSQPHAKFAIRNNQFVVADMLSKNGTLVNGNKIESVTPLNENDVIQIGGTVFVLKTMQ